MKNEDKAITVFSGELWQATMLKNILEDNDIPAFLNNEYLGTVAPYIVDAGGIPNVRVVVNSEHEQAALMLVKEFNDSAPL